MDLGVFSWKRKILEDSFRKEVGKNIVFLKELLNTKKLA